MASDTSLVFNLLAKDKVSGALGKVGKNVGKLGLAVAGMAAAAGVGLAKVGADFDAAFDTIAIGTGATGTKLEGLKSDFKEALADTPAEMGLVADAMTQLNTLTGATGETLQDLTVGVAEASRMLGEDGAANAQVFGQALKQWQIPAEEGQANLDALFKATQDYGVSLQGIIGHLNTYGPVLQNAGFSMEESAALFGQLESAGISVSRVMPGLNKSFRDWAGEGKNLQSELGKTVNKIANAKDSTKALSIATDAFGAEGAQRMTTAIRSGAISLDDLSTALGGAEGLIGSTADSTDSWQEKLQKLKNKGLVALEPVASTVFEAIGVGVEKVTPIVEDLGKGFEVFFGALSGQSELNEFDGHLKTLNNAGIKVRGVIRTIGSIVQGTLIPAFQSSAGFVSRNSGLFKTLAGVIAGVVVVTKLHTAAMAVQAAGGIVSFITSYLKGIKLVQVATKTWTALQWLLNIALKANLIGLIVVAIAALVAAFVIAYKNSETFRNIVNAVFRAVGKVVKMWWEKLVKPYFRLLRKGFDLIVRAAKVWWSGVKKYFGFWKGAVNKIVGWVTGLKDRVTSIFNRVVGFVRKLPGRIRRAASGMWNGIRDAFRSALNWIIDRWNGLSFTLPSVTLLGQTFGGQTLSTPNIPRFARGGTVPGRGPQWAIVHGGEEIRTPAQQRSDSDTGPITIEVYLDGRKIGGAVKQVVRKERRTSPAFRAELASGRL